MMNCLRSRRCCGTLRVVVWCGGRRAPMLLPCAGRRICESSLCTRCSSSCVMLLDKNRALTLSLIAGEALSPRASLSLNMASRARLYRCAPSAKSVGVVRVPVSRVGFRAADCYVLDCQSEIYVWRGESVGGVCLCPVVTRANQAGRRARRRCTARRTLPRISRAPRAASCASSTTASRMMCLQRSTCSMACCVVSPLVPVVRCLSPQHSLRRRRRVSSPHRACVLRVRVCRVLVDDETTGR